MRISDVVKVSQSVVKKHADKRPDYGYIQAIDGKRVDVLVGQSRASIKNVQVVGDVNTLTTGMRVQLSWWDARRPVVVAGGGSGSVTISGSSVSGMDAATLQGHDGNYYLSRSNQIGTQSPSTISPQGSGSGLDADLLDGHDSLYFVPNTRQVNPGTGLTGGGALSADITLSVVPGTPLNNSVNLASSTEGVATTFTRSDHTHQLDQSIAPTWTGDHTFEGLTVTRSIVPQATDTYDLGSSTILWRKGWLSELDTILFAKNTITLLGGWFMVSKGEGATAGDIAATTANTTADLGTGADAFTVGDFLLFRGSLAVEYMQLVTYISGTTWTFSRNLDGSGANHWVSGSVYVNLGQSGDGRIELNSYDTPRINLLTQGATYNAQTELMRIGDLNSNWGYSSETFGVAIGRYASGYANWRWDASNGIRIYSYSTLVAQWQNNGAITIGNTATNQPNTLINSTQISLRSGTTARVKLNSDTSGFIGSHITWDTSGNITITNATLSITNGNFTLKSATSGSRIEFDSTSMSIYYSSTMALRIGNLNGYYGISAARYGIGVGDYTGGNYLRYDPTNGFTLKAGNGAITLTSSGLTFTQGTNTVNGISWSALTGSNAMSVVGYEVGGNTFLYLDSNSPAGVGKIVIAAEGNGSTVELDLTSGSYAYLSGALVTNSTIDSGPVTTPTLTATSSVVIKYSGTQIGDIKGLDTSWLRINTTATTNIYTPRGIRADGGLIAGSGVSLVSNEIRSTGYIRTNTGYYSRGYRGGIFIPSTTTLYMYDSTSAQWDYTLSKSAATYTFYPCDANNGLAQYIQGIVVRIAAKFSAAGDGYYIAVGGAMGTCAVQRSYNASVTADFEALIPLSYGTNPSFQIIIAGGSVVQCGVTLVGVFI